MAPGQGSASWLSSSELPGSWPVPSVSPAPHPQAVPAALACDSPSCTLPPPLPTEEVARCPLPGTEDKNNQWKNTRGSRSNINLRDPACRRGVPSQAPCPPTCSCRRLPLPMTTPSHSWTVLTTSSSRKCPPTRGARAQVWPGQPTQSGDFGERLLLHSVSGLPGESLCRRRSAQFLGENKPCNPPGFPQVFCSSAAMPNSLRFQKEGEGTRSPDSAGLHPSACSEATWRRCWERQAGEAFHPFRHPVCPGSGLSGSMTRGRVSLPPPPRAQMTLPAHLRPPASH